ncbi:DUF2155 domain-containing protein [Geothermobacter ehrlichii]|uniref:DUF2155 domain-containing protein n=1 Tax=Geothermobacter ehrlichii TaxID=213224 RepID=UPI001FEB1CA4|nr:DUF2155 domain-containing protein [Geothermobacter ehrlichii]
MKRAGLVIFVVTVFAAFGLGGCGKQEEKKPKVEARPAKTEVQVRKSTTPVEVPDSVKGHWKAVKISVRDKDAGTEEVYTVDIGHSFELPGAGITFKVNAFLPHFVMDGRKLTSMSNDTRNPAVQVEIKENGKMVFDGWLFSLYPNTHAFKHPRYTFSLVDYIPAEGKKG